uniref:DUF202 domain-containing protein n=1 Tax=Echinostoma caproni TaxID=27848 RepID=A0A183A357_9TREM
LSASLSLKQAHQKAEVVPVFSIEREWAGVGNPHVPGNDDPGSVLSSTEEPFSLAAEWIARSVSRSNTAVNLSYTLIAEVAVNLPHPDPKLVALWEQSVIVVAALCTFSLIRRRNRLTGISSSVNAEYYNIQDFFVQVSKCCILFHHLPRMMLSTFFSCSIFLYAIRCGPLECNAHITLC